MITTTPSGAGKKTSAITGNDLTGKRFGPFIVIGIYRIGVHGKQRQWEVKCDCGRTRYKPTREVEAAKYCSRGCAFRKADLAKRLKSHGHSKHLVYGVWTSIKGRCFNPQDNAFHNYGGRGITMSPEWENSFEQFWIDMSPAWEKGLEIDRRDNDGPYCRENCHWVTKQVNSTNKRISYKNRGYPENILELGNRRGLSDKCVGHRIRKGWTTEQILAVPMGAKCPNPPVI